MLRSNRFASKFRHKMLLLFSLVIIVFVYLICLDLRKFINDEIEEFQTKVNTFSSIVGLYDDGRIVSQNLTKHNNDYYVFFRNIFKSIERYLFSREIQTQKVKLFIKFENLRQLYLDREQALARGLNLEPKFVPCKITDGTKRLKCKVRLKGDLSDHWSSATRFSLKVKVSGGYIHGLKSFSIQKPSARQFPYDQTFHALANAMGSHSSNDQRFYSIEVNEKSWGIMNVEPDIDQTFIEGSELKRFGVFKISDQRYWLYNIKYGGLSGYYLSDPRINLSLKGKEEKLVSTVAMAEVYEFISNSLFIKDGSIFSREMMIDNLVLGFVWGGLHALFNANSSYTWNAYTQRLEPILTDQEFWKPIDKRFFSEAELPFEYKILASKQPIESYELLASLKKIEDSVRKINPRDYSNFLKLKYFPNDRLFTYDPISKNIAYLKENIIEITSWVNNAAKSNFSRSTKSIIDHLSNISNVVEIDAYDEKKFRIYNLTNLSGTIKHIEVAGNIFKTDITSLPASSDGEIGFLDIPFEYKKEKIEEIGVVVEFEKTSWRAKVRKHITSYPGLTSGVINPFCRFVDEHCELTGNIKISENVEFRVPVVVKSGTVINISNGANIIFKSSLSMNGTVNNKVLVHGDKTGGIVIINKPGHVSTIKNSVFSKLSEVNSYLRRYTGAVNGYGGVFRLSGVSFIDCLGEDQLNLVHTSIDVTSAKFLGAPSDAFDCDFCKGNIKEIEFYTVGGDALDVSGSNIDVGALKVVDVRDKAVSVGERSSIHIANLNVKRVSTGIAVKDGSTSIVGSLIAEDIVNDVMMTYIKKPFYNSPTRLNVTSVQVRGSLGGQVCIRQTDTQLSYNEMSCLESAVAVDKLYQGRMKK